MLYDPLLFASFLSERHTTTLLKLCLDWSRARPTARIRAISSFKKCEGDRLLWSIHSIWKLQTIGGNDQKQIRSNLHELFLLPRWIMYQYIRIRGRTTDAYPSESAYNQGKLFPIPRQSETSFVWEDQEWLRIMCDFSITNNCDRTESYSSAFPSIHQDWMGSSYEKASKTNRQAC